jgi:hypothetical protein
MRERERERERESKSVRRDNEERKPRKGGASGLNRRVQFSLAAFQFLEWLELALPALGEPWRAVFIQCNGLCQHCSGV